MSLRVEIEALRSELANLAAEVDTGLTQRYALWHPPGQRRTLYRRFRKALGRLLRRLHLRPTQPLEPWEPGLNYVEHSNGARALLVWAQGTDPEQLRDACRGVERLLDDLPGWAPVLVTDVADFAFYSRLGWLVEYLPALSRPADGYRERKRRYLASRYRDAPALPVSVGLAGDVRTEDLLID
jgi:hypothetical protein